MKNLILLLLLACSWAAQAQIVQYVNINGNEQNFYKLGGYSYTEQSFPSGVQATPYVRMGPSPQNDFMYVVTATGGIKNLNNGISTTNVGTGITLKMKNNNIKKFGANVITRTPDGTTITGEAMILRVYTNQGNGQSYIFSNSSITWMGLVATGENEYIDSVKVSYISTSTNVITIGEIIVGDSQAQNVALNFDGVNDHVALPSTVGNFASNDNFTVSCWVKPASLQNDLVNTDVEILEKWDGTSAAYPFVIRYLNENIANSNAGNVGKIVAARYNGIAAPSIMSSVSIKDGNWHNIVFVVDNLGMHLFIDGVSVANGNDFTPQQANTPCTNNSALYVGSRNGINHFKGEIDEVRLWTVAKNQTDILNERFCKNPNTTGLQAAYNFSNGVPNGNNNLITQVPDAVGTNNGILSGFAKTGDASNFITGQVKYVNSAAAGNQSGNSWGNAYPTLQYALSSNTCNDLFDIYVSKGNYITTILNDATTSFNIYAGMKLYGGFAGTEKNINERNMALIHTTNITTLTGDLSGNDTPFNFASNRTDNSNNIVKLLGSNVILDGFKISGATNSAVNIPSSVSNIKIQNCIIADNSSSSAGAGISIENAISNSQITNCKFLGNSSSYGAVRLLYMNSPINVQNCLFSGNSIGIKVESPYSNATINLINSSFSGNGTAIDEFVGGGATINNNFTNCILHSNNAGINKTISVEGAINDNITYSLVQGIVSGTGNLNGNTTNPNFLNPIIYSNPTDAGDYRLKWCSLAIGAGNNTGISPLDLNRNPRLYRTNVDMGAYEHMGNTPTGASPIDITYTIDIPNYSGVGVQRITSAAKILAPAGTVNFNAPNSITLNPGFEARGMSSYFKAQIGANVTCSN